jgi:hypothetical protein
MCFVNPSQRQAFFGPELCFIDVNSFVVQVATERCSRSFQLADVKLSANTHCPIDIVILDRVSVGPLVPFF